MQEAQNNDSHMHTGTQQKYSTSKGSGKDNKGTSCSEQVSVSFVLHDVITYHNTSLVFCLYYNQRLGDMEVK